MATQQQQLDDTAAVVLDADRYRLCVDGVWVHVTPAERAILLLLLAEDRVVPAERLYAASSGLSVPHDDALLLVQSHVRNLRLKLGRHKRKLRNIRSVGYWLDLEDTRG